MPAPQRCEPRQGGDGSACELAREARRAAWRGAVMTPGSLDAFGALCALAGAINTHAISAPWARHATGEGEVADTSDHCIECGNQHVPLYDGKCIPCRFGRYMPARN